MSDTVYPRGYVNYSPINLLKISNKILVMFGIFMYILSA